MTFTFPIERADGARLVDGMLVLAALDRTTLRPVRVPEALRAAFGKSPTRLTASQIEM
jgi:acyl-CoA thioesterase FadM